MGRGLLWFVVANILAILLFPIGFAWGMIKCIRKGKLLRAIREADAKLFALAKAVDQYGNVVCGELFNDSLKTKAGIYRFGYIYQTISAVLGHNETAGTLSGAGVMLCAILNRIDRKHTQKAAQADKFKYL